MKSGIKISAQFLPPFFHIPSIFLLTKNLKKLLSLLFYIKHAILYHIIIEINNILKCLKLVKDAYLII